MIIIQLSEGFIIKVNVLDGKVNYVCGNCVCYIKKLKLAEFVTEVILALIILMLSDEESFGIITCYCILWLCV